MIRLTSIDLENLKVIGEGMYAISYLKEGQVYKIYKEIIDYGNGWYSKNLALKEKKHRIAHLKKLNEKLEHSEILEDTIYIDDKYAGIMHKYINGKRLDEISKQLSFEDKKTVAYRILDSVIEETNNGIYKRDIHTGNIIVDDDLNVTIVDLDDLHTNIYFPNNKRKIKRDGYILTDTIKKLFNDYKQFYVELEEVKKHDGLDYSKFFENKKTKDMTTYEEFYEYLDKKDESISILFVYGINDIELFKQIGKDKKMILITNSLEEKELYSLGSYYEKFGIKFSDAIEESQKEELIKSYKIREIFNLKNNQIKPENQIFTKNMPNSFGK